MLYVNPHSATSFLANDMAPGSKKREAEALQQFEQLFLYQMLKEMRKTIPDYGVMDSSQQAYFDEMMDDFLAGEMAKSGQLGIAEQLADQIAARDKGATDSASYTQGISLDDAAGVPLIPETPAGIPLPAPRRGFEAYRAFSPDPGLETGLGDKR